MKNKLDLYTDYLLSSFGQTSATGLSRLLDGELSHDAVTRFLSGNELDSKTLWQTVKKDVRRHESEQGCLTFDDVTMEKPHMEETDLACWHYDHSKGKSARGINMLNAFYETRGPPESEALRIPAGFGLHFEDGSLL